MHRNVIYSTSQPHFFTDRYTCLAYIIVSTQSSLRGVKKEGATSAEDSDKNILSLACFDDYNILCIFFLSFYILPEGIWIGAQPL